MYHRSHRQITRTVIWLNCTVSKPTYSLRQKWEQKESKYYCTVTKPVDSVRQKNGKN